MTSTLIIARRELRSSFDTPMPYIVLCIGLPVLALFFFNYEGGFWQANRASMTTLIGMTAKFIALLASVLTMRVMADEKRTGTLEMLITLPVKDHEVILGKFLGTWLVVLAALGTTLLFPLMMFVWPWNLGALDWGPVLAGYLGLALASAAAVAIGMLVSSITESQVIAFVLTFFLLVFLFTTTMYIGQIDPTAADGTRARFWLWVLKALEFCSWDSRVNSMARGLITTRDILHFLSITVLCLMASFRALERRKWA